MSSCTQRLTDFTVISTKNMPIEGQVSMHKGDQRVKGEDHSWMILFIPTGTPNLKEAIDKAIESRPGCVGLADGVVKTFHWWAFLAGKTGYIVEGTPLYTTTNYSGSNNQTVQFPSNQVNNNQPSDSSNQMIFKHVVKAGETLASIAQLYNVSIRELIQWNNLHDNNVSAGTELFISVK